ncbi:MAG: hypothetical protein IT162_09735 [Bryobacterales bacterium]|nr:hypothetical protein [Bryobacterales bacterium]
MADELVATTMHLPRVRYLLPGDARTLAPTNIDFPGREIIVNASAYRGAPEPLETVLLLRDTQDLQSLLNRVECDFLLPARRLRELNTQGRRILPERNGWVIVLSPPAVKDFGQPPFPAK